MLNRDGNENGNKIKFSRAAHIFGHFFAFVLHDWYISQFQLCLAPLPLRGYCGAVAHLVSPRGGALQILRCTEAGHLPTELLTCSRFSIRM